MSGSPVTFAAATAYTATITLTAQTGFTFSGVAANTFIVAGASATNAANTGSVTAVFPATAATSVSFSGLSANGTSGTATTTTLTLAFDVDPTTLTASDITVTGATKGTLNNSGSTRTLAITGITVANGQNITVTIASPQALRLHLQARLWQRTIILLVSQWSASPLAPSSATSRRGQQHSISFSDEHLRDPRAQFLAIMGTDPSDLAHSSGTSDPVQMTNWYHAIAFCNKLSIAEGLTPVYGVANVDFTALTYTQIPVLPMPPGMRPPPP